MSRNRDTRIVEMQFDNVRFEQNASRTLSTLDKLKQAMKFEGITDGFKKIEKASGTLTFKTLSDGVQTVSNKFSALNAVAFSVLNNITNQAVNAGRNLVNSLTLEPVTTGFQEYEIKMGSVQVLAANLGALTEDTANNLKLTASEMQAVEDAINGVYGSGANRIKALAEAGYDYERIQQGINKETAKNSSTNKENKASMEEINQTLERMNTFADKTIYNYAQMTSNLGKFVAAGVDLDRSEKAITGLAALAAMSGATAQDMSRASYQMSQAMGTGFIKLMDWNSLVNANMGTKGFQDQIMDVARSHGVAVDEIIKANGSFRDSLAEGWLTTDIFLETLQRYTDESTELGQTAMKAATEVKSVSMLLDTLKESVQSGWTQSWELIIGDYFEAKTILTQINDEINAILKPMEDWRNLQLQVWHDASNGRDEFIEDMGKFFKFIGKVLEPIKDAFVEVFDLDNGDAVLIKLTSRFTQFVNKLEITDETADKLKRTFKGVFSIFKIVGNSIRAVLNVIGKQIGGVDFANSGAFSTMADWGDQLEELSNTTFSVENIEQSLYDLGDAIKEFISTLSEQIQNSSIVKFIKNLFGSKEETDELTGTIDTVSDGFTKTKSIVDQIRDLKKSLGSSKEKEGSSDDSSVSWLNTFTSKLGESLSKIDVVDTIQTVGAIAAIIQILHTVFSSTKKVEAAAEAIKKFPETIVHFFDKLGDALVAKSRYESMAAIAAAIGITATSIYLLGNMDTGKLWQGIAVVSVVGVALLVMNGITTHIGKMKEGTKFEKVYYSYVAFASALGIIVLSLWALTKIIDSTNAETLAISLTMLADIIVTLVGVVAVTSKLVKNGDDVVKAGAGLLIFSIGIATIVTSLIGLELVMKNANSDAIWGLVGLVAVLVGGMALLVAVVGAVKPEKMASIGFGLAEMSAGLSVLINSLVLLQLSMRGASGDAIAGLVLAIVGTISALALLVAVIGALKPEQMLSTGAGIAVIAIGIGSMFKAVAKLKGMDENQLMSAIGLIMATGLVVVAIMEFSKKLEQGQAKEIKKLITSISAGIVAVIAMIYLLTKVPQEDLTNALKTFEAVSKTMIILVSIIAVFAIVIKAIDTFSAKSGAIVKAGSQMGSQKIYTGIIKFGIALQTVTMAILEFGEGVYLFNEGIKTMLENLEKLATTDISTISDGFGNLFKGITSDENRQSLGDFIIKSLTEAGERIPELIGVLTQGFVNTLNQISESIGEVGEAWLGVFESATGFVSDNAERLGEDIRDLLIGMFTVAKTIFGTTAEEESKGVTGSPLVDSIVDALVAMLTAVGTTLSTRAEDISSAAGSLGKGIWDVLSYAVDGAVGTISSDKYQMDMWDQWWDGLTVITGNDAPKTMQKNLEYGLGNMMDAISKSDNIFDAATEIGANWLVTALGNNMGFDVQALFDEWHKKNPSGKMSDFVMHLLTKMIDQTFVGTIAHTIKKIDEAVASFVGELIKKFKDKVDEIKGIGTDIIETIVKGFKLITQNPIDTIKDMITGSWQDKWGEVGGDIYNIGQKIINAIKNGILNFNPISIMGELAAKLKGAFEDENNINSPSKDYEEIAKYIPMGIAEGIKKGAQKPERETVNLAEKCKNAFNQNIKKSMNLSEIVEDTVSDPVIRPRVDLSDVNAGANAVNSMFGNYSVGLASRTANSIDTNMMEKARQAYTKSSNNKTLVDSVNGLREDMRYYADAQSKTNIVLDTGVLVGSTASKMDRQLGIRAARAKRGN